MLFIVATPIGNLEDITLRALRVLREADLIIAEDTRHTGLLLKHFEIPHKPMISLYKEVEIDKINDILASAKELKVVLVSDAGTPLISDPGYKLVREALTQNLPIESVPGPNAAITALTLSGLPPDKFLFLGYPPEKESHTRQVLEKYQNLNATIIFYVSPHKLLRFLGLLKEDREIVIARELTKIHQEIWRGKPSEALVKFSKPQGEFVVLWNAKLS